MVDLGFQVTLTVDVTTLKILGRADVHFPHVHTTEGCENYFTDTVLCSNLLGFLIEQPEHC
jgi:hypothetical protein